MKFARSIIFLGLSLCLSQCGSNVFGPTVSSTSERYYIAKAQEEIDQQKYDDAIETLAKVETNSNEKVFLQIASQLGSSGLSLWNIIKDLLDSNNFASRSGSGADKVFDLLNDTFFGVADTRVQRLKSLASGIESLKLAPDQDSRVENYRCFLAGILALPSVTDGSSAITAVTTSLQDISTEISQGGNSQECSSIDTFESNLTRLTQVQEDLALALKETQDCPLFSSLSNADQMNKVEALLDKFKTAADKGCISTECTLGEAACEALSFGCVGAVLGASSAVAGDGKIEKCEIVQNCGSGSCF